MIEKMEKDHLCNRAMEFILTQPVKELKDLTVADIARHLDVSHSYLSRKFKVERLFSLRDYLFREKMARSVSMLLEKTDLTIPEVAEKIGFFDADYFAYVFKHYFGISPGRYRTCKRVKN